MPVSKQRKPNRKTVPKRPGKDVVTAILESLGKSAAARQAGDPDAAGDSLAAAAEALAPLFLKGQEDLILQLMLRMEDDENWRHQGVSRDFDEAMDLLVGIASMTERAPIYTCALALIPDKLALGDDVDQIERPVELERSLAQHLGVTPSSVRCHPRLFYPNSEVSALELFDCCIESKELVAQAEPPPRVPLKARPPGQGRHLDAEECNPDPRLLVISVWLNPDPDGALPLLSQLDESIEDWVEDRTFALPYRKGRTVRSFDAHLFAAAGPFDLVRYSAYRDEREGLAQALEHAKTQLGGTLKGLAVILAPVYLVEDGEEDPGPDDPPKTDEDIDGFRLTLWADELKETVSNLAFDFVLDPGLFLSRVAADLYDDGVPCVLLEDLMPAAECPDCGALLFYAPEDSPDAGHDHPLH